MQRFLNKGTQFAVDVVTLSLAFWLALLLRFDFALPQRVLDQALWAWPVVVALEYVALSLLGVPRFSWRFFHLRDAQWAIAALATAAAAFLAIRLAWPRGAAPWPVVLPLSVIGGNFILATWGVVGVRVLRRLIADRDDRRRRQQPQLGADKHLLIGAGQAGALVARELLARPHLHIAPIGFLDDDPVKRGSRVHGLPVFGAVDSLREVAREHGVHHVIIAMAGAPGERIRKIVQLCRDADIETKMIPSLDDIVRGRKRLSELREVAIEDLLGRPPVDLESEELSSVLSNRVVMVTGAGGSIGAELCRQIALFGPRTLLLVEHNENALFHIHRELTALRHPVELKPCIADIRDKVRMAALFADNKPSVVVHAAAHKHVPMMEWNPGEAVKNNVFGTQVLADLADRYAVERFVTISTDKAVNPTSVMGATKRVAEIYTQSLSQRSGTRFVAVRFGNVLGSAGSVVPIFQEQIRRGGPVTVTDAEMRRYFMTISEACQLVLRACALGEGGEIFVLDMGEPVRIADLARDLISLSGLEPDVDIPIVYTGRRPGEKLFEELSVAAEKADKTRHPKIFVGRIAPHRWSEVRDALAGLRQATDIAHPEDVRRSLSELVPEFRCPTPQPMEAAS